MEILSKYIEITQSSIRYLSDGSLYFVGCRISRVFDEAKQYFVYYLSQAEYARKVVERFEKVYNEQTPRKFIPAWIEDDSAAPPTKHDAKQDVSSNPRTWIGALLFLSRLTRPNMMTATIKLARRVNSWTNIDTDHLKTVI